MFDSSQYSWMEDVTFFNFTTTHLRVSYDMIKTGSWFYVREVTKSTKN